MKEISLTRGKVALVDDEDFEWLSQYRWHATSTGYAKRYVLRSERGKGPSQVYMHRMILGIVEFPDVMVDHIDMNRLNNTRNNLRRCNESQNALNKKATRASRTGLKGVTKPAIGPNWYAYISVNGKKKHIGSFKTPEEAYAAYCMAASQAHGEFFNPG